MDYVVAGLLASVSVLIGNARWAAASPEWMEPPTLWLCSVGSPSAGKSPALDATISMVRHLEQEAIKATKDDRLAHEEMTLRARTAKAAWQRQMKEACRTGKTSPAQPTDAIEPAPVPLPRILVGDTTPEGLAALLRDNPKGLLLYRDEIAGWIGSFGRYSPGTAGERAFWTEAYGGRAYTIDRQKNPEPTIVPHLAVSVLGCIQPDKLALVTGVADDGFASRMLWFWPELVSEFRLQRMAVGSTDQLSALRWLQALGLHRAADGILKPRSVFLCDASAALFESFVIEVKGRAREATGLMASALGKAPGHVLRLALVLEYLRWSENLWRPEPDQISKDATAAAIRLIDGYFLVMAKRVFGEATIPEKDRLAMELARWIARERPLRFNARQTRRSLSGVLRDPKGMATACEMLTEASWIRPADKPSGPGTGRPSTNHDVNPALLAKLKAK